MALIYDRGVIDLPAMLRPPATLRVAMRAGIALQAGRIPRHLDLWPAYRDVRGRGGLFRSRASGRVAVSSGSIGLYRILVRTDSLKYHSCE